MEPEFTPILTKLNRERLEATSRAGLLLFSHNVFGEGPKLLKSMDQIATLSGLDATEKSLLKTNVVHLRETAVSRGKIVHDNKTDTAWYLTYQASDHLMNIVYQYDKKAFYPEVGCDVNHKNSGIINRNANITMRPQVLKCRIPVSSLYDSNRRYVNLLVTPEQVSKANIEEILLQSVADENFRDVILDTKYEIFSNGDIFKLEVEIESVGPNLVRSEWYQKYGEAMFDGVTRPVYVRRSGPPEGRRIEKAADKKLTVPLLQRLAGRALS